MGFSVAHQQSINMMIVLFESYPFWVYLLSSLLLLSPFSDSLSHNAMALLAIGTVTASAASLSSHLSRHLSFSRTQTSSPQTASLSFSATSLTVAAPVTVANALPPLVYCGRGDRKTAKGKRFSHSFGNFRPRNKKRGRGPPRVPIPPSPPKKDKFDDGEKVKIDIDESLFS